MKSTKVQTLGEPHMRRTAANDGLGYWIGGLPLIARREPDTG